ncbi:MAG: MATE family efflux transporter [Clostridiales bacterium]|nr:MATE family efflux transporter [Clostridiales bacterium]
MGKDILVTDSPSNVDEAAAPREFFTRDKSFYKTLFMMALTIILQNIITYSVNVADNIMLGTYKQSALAGAAAVNQIQYMLQMLTISGWGEGLVALAARFWGAKDVKNVQKTSGLALIMGVSLGLIITLLAFLFPDKLVAFFAEDAEIRAQALDYLSLMRYSYIMFIITSLLLVTMRSVQRVGIAFKVSCLALVVNVTINSILIYGRFGAPEMGIRGAAIGTLVARCLEFIVVLIYTRSKKLPIRLRLSEMFPPTRELLVNFLRIALPCIAASLMFGMATTIHTVIFGHVSADAMAASTAASTLFQYVKMIPMGVSSAAAVIIAKTIGSGELRKIKPYVRTLQVIFASFGVLASVILLLLRNFVIGLYTITPQAKEFALQMLIVQSIMLVGTSYQAPCQVGIIRPGGDSKYVMVSDMLYSWGFTVPLSLLAAFVFHWPVVAIVICLNVDQLLKCVTVSYKLNRYTWIKKLAVNSN